MTQKTRSKTALRCTDKGPEVKKRSRDTDTEDAPSKKAKYQHKVDGVSGKKVLYLSIITFKHSVADHDIRHIDQTK